MYKLVAFDLDGTLLNQDHKIQESSKKVIAELKKQGIKIILSTGRHHTAALHYYNELALDTPLLCCNGTYAYLPSTQEIFYANPIPVEDTKYVLDEIQKNPAIGVMIYIKDTMVYEKESAKVKSLLDRAAGFALAVRPRIDQVESLQGLLQDNPLVWKIVLLGKDREFLDAFMKSLPKDKYDTDWSWIDQADVMRAGNNKANLLETILVDFNISPSETIAFGDNFNDVSMIRLAGLGVLMGNAHEDIKHEADLVIGANTTDAVAQTLIDVFKLNMEL